MESTMDLVPLFKRVVLGAAGASLDIAGAALLPGAWPILKRALEPVLERLQEQLGGESITASPAQAQQAVAHFEADRHLQEVLRSKLVEQLDPIIQHQQHIDADVQKLILVVAGNQQLLADLVGGMERFERHLDEGVNLSDEAIEKLSHVITRQAETSRQMRTVARREMTEPVAALIQRQVHRLQIRADELLRRGELDRASDELREGILLLATLLSEAPTDITLQLQLGFIFKTISQVFEAARQEEQAQLYLEKALDVFSSVMDGMAAEQKTAEDIKHAVDSQTLVNMANVIHGIGNYYHGKRDFTTAIEYYTLATSLWEAQCYSWHDMFLAYHELAKHGEVHLDEMRHALEMVKQTGLGQPGLSAQYIAAELGGMLHELENR